LFAFRMLMVLFRREFSFVDTLYLWEVSPFFCAFETDGNGLFIIQNKCPHIFQNYRQAQTEGYYRVLSLLFSLFPYLFTLIIYSHHWSELTENRRLLGLLYFQLMWAMEYSPKLFSMYESDTKVDTSADAANEAVLKQYGKFERKKVRMGQHNDKQTPLSIFLVAGVLEAQNRKLLQEAKGLDDVVKVSQVLLFMFFSHLCIYASTVSHF